MLKEKKISEDESKDYESQVQKNTDEKILTIEKILTEKEKEILTLWTKLTILPLSWMEMEDGEKKEVNQEITDI